MVHRRRMLADGTSLAVLAGLVAFGIAGASAKKPKVRKPGQLVMATQSYTLSRSFPGHGSRLIQP